MLKLCQRLIESDSVNFEHVAETENLNLIRLYEKSWDEQWTVCYSKIYGFIYFVKTVDKLNAS